VALTVGKGPNPSWIFLARVESDIDTSGALPYSVEGPSIPKYHGVDLLFACTPFSRFCMR
jgi:hypothetical protein